MAPAGRPLKRAVLPVLESVKEPGEQLNVQFPAGNPESDTEPVATVQVGCTINPIVGAAGIVTGLTKTWLDGEDVQPFGVIATVNV